MNKVEVWKDVKGYEGIYQVSSFGRVKSLDRVKKYSDGRVFKYNGRILKQSIGTNGYLGVHLYDYDGRRETKEVHRLVAETFLFEKDLRDTVNHKDGIKNNNRIENLEWMSQSENNSHALQNGLRKNPPSGLKSNLSKLYPEMIIDVLKNCKPRVTDASLKDFSSKYNVSSPTIRKILNNFKLEDFEVGSYG